MIWNKVASGTSLKDIAGNETAFAENQKARLDLNLRLPPTLNWVNNGLRSRANLMLNGNTVSIQWTKGQEFLTDIVAIIVGLAVHPNPRVLHIELDPAM